MISSTFFCRASFMSHLSIALGSYFKESLFCQHFRTIAGLPKARFDLKMDKIQVLITCMFYLLIQMYLKLKDSRIEF